MGGSTSSVEVVKEIIDVDLDADVKGGPIAFIICGNEISDAADGRDDVEALAETGEAEVEEEVANPLVGVAADRAVMVVNGNGGTNEKTESVDLLLLRPRLCMMWLGCRCLHGVFGEGGWRLNCPLFFMAFMSTNLILLFDAIVGEGGATLPPGVFELPSERDIGDEELLPPPLLLFTDDGDGVDAFEADEVEADTLVLGIVAEPKQRFVWW